MDAAHNMSVRSVAGPEQKLVMLCLLSRSYRIGFLKSAAKIQIKNEIFLRSCEKVLNLTFSFPQKEKLTIDAMMNNA